MKVLTGILGLVFIFWIADYTVAQGGVKVEWGAPWGNWTKCSKTCGGGITERLRYCTTPGVKESRCVRRRQKPCNRKPCPVAASPVPTDPPSPAPSDAPSPSPEMTASPVPTDPPSPTPTDPPSSAPTDPPSSAPTDPPSSAPTDPPSPAPSDAPSPSPEMTASPVTTDPPSSAPTDPPSPAPSDAPSPSPEMTASSVPTDPPSSAPTDPPSPAPSDAPSPSPEMTASPASSDSPSPSPSEPQTSNQTITAPAVPSDSPSTTPSESPSTTPTDPPASSPEMTDFPATMPETVDPPKPMPENTDEPMTDPEEPIGIDPTSWPEGENMGDKGIFKMGSWGEWSSCSMLCGGGVKYRARECENPNGKPECEEVESATCNSYPCDIGVPVGEPEPSAEPTSQPEGYVSPMGEAEPTSQPEGYVSPVGEAEPTSQPEGYVSPVGEAEPTSQPEGYVSPVGEAEPTSQPEGYVSPVGEAEPTSQPEGYVSPVGEGIFKMGSWGVWSSCSMLCGGGVKYRARECENPDGKPECEEVESAVCNSSPCDTGVPAGEPEPSAEPTSQPEGYVSPMGEAEPTSQPEGYVSPVGEGMRYKDWGDWDECSASCGGGMRYRVRECMKENGEKNCEDSQSETCNVMACPKDPEPTDSSVYVTSTMSLLDKQREEKRLKKICGQINLKASNNVIRKAVSPGYPDDYPAGLDCMWTITASLFRRVEITIEHLELAEGDKLTVLEGRIREMPYTSARIVTLTGKVKPGTTYTSFGRYMTIRLQSREKSKGGRYTIAYSGTKLTPGKDKKNEKSDDPSEGEMWYRMLKIFTEWFQRLATKYSS